MNNSTRSLTSRIMQNIRSFRSRKSNDVRNETFSLFLITAELKMDVLREREVKDSLERQLQDEQKVRGEYPIS